MTTRITISVNGEKNKSAVVSFVDDKGCQLLEPSAIVDSGSSKDFYIYPNHNITIWEIDYDKVVRSLAKDSSYASIPSMSKLPPSTATVNVPINLH